MKILKFGGSSIANAKNIKKVIQIISQASKKCDLVVVVSAFGGVTDNLIESAWLASERKNKYQLLIKNIHEQHKQAVEKLIEPKRRKKVLAEIDKKCFELEEALNGISLLKELSLRSLDAIMSFGEQLSADIICQAIKNQKIACKFIDARTLIKTDDNFGSANVEIQESYKLISAHFKNSPKISIMGGFIGSTNEGVTTTLGRGGSDYTASLVGAALGASIIEIWTDVDGVMTADPAKVKSAFLLSEISYEEANELAHFGAKIVHPKTMKPARMKNIPIHLKNTFNPRGKGTRISNNQSKQKLFVKGISSLNNIVLLRIQSNNGHNIGQIAARVFEVLTRHEIEILLVTQASHEQSISIAVNKKQANKAKIVIEKDFDLELKARQIFPISIEGNLSIVAVVGKQMKGVPGISGKAFKTLGDNKINVVAIAQGSSELNISIVISSKDEIKALQSIHKAFFESDNKIIHLFVVGTGLIGSTLLRQIESQKKLIRLCGLANDRNMLLNNQGIPLKDWKKKLWQSKSIELQSFVKQMTELNLANSVFVDCTASEEVVSWYENIINAGIAIVTPNKKANSGLFRQYQKLKDLAEKKQMAFLYETNVGAGLPIIYAIKNLVSSGDEILKIEAVLSGTLSYIFNVFSESNKVFSQIVREAKNKGYTEPDPRQDLNGADVARKILILARESGLRMEFNQIKIVPMLPKKYFKIESIEEFFIELEKLNSDFEKKKNQAKKKNHLLRYVATLNKGKAKISLREVGPRHPFYHLSGSDNIISLTTKRYNETPLVIRGPGAGAEVTAGGVLADIINIIK